MDASKQKLWNVFCVIFRPGTLDHHRQQEKMSLFSSIILRLRLFNPTQ